MNINKWLNLYKSSWEEKNEKKLDFLFEEYATYFETPCNKISGIKAIKEYWKNETLVQRNILFSIEDIFREDNQGVFIVTWNCKYLSLKSDDYYHLSGIMILKFNANKCYFLKEYWHKKNIKGQP